MSLSIADAIAVLDLARELGFEPDAALQLKMRVAKCDTPLEDATIQADYAAFRDQFASSYSTSTDPRVRRILATDEAAKVADADALRRRANELAGEIPTLEPIATAATEPTSREAYKVIGRWMGAGYADERGDLNPAQFKTWDDIVNAFKLARETGWSGDWFQLLRMMALTGPVWNRASLVDPAATMRALHAIARSTPAGGTPGNFTDIRSALADLVFTRLGGIQSYAESSDFWTDTECSKDVLDGLRLATAVLEIIKGVPPAIAAGVATSARQVPEGETLPSYVERVIATIHQKFGSEVVRLAAEKNTTPEQMLDALQRKVNPVVTVSANAEKSERPVEPREPGTSGSSGMSAAAVEGQTMVRNTAPVRRLSSMTFVPRTPQDIGIGDERALSDWEYRYGIKQGTPITLKTFQAASVTPATSVPFTPARNFTGFRTVARASVGGVASIGTSAATFGVSLGTTMALFGEWERFRNISTSDLLRFFVGFSVLFTGFRFGMKQIFSEVAERSFNGGFLFHGIPLVASMFAANMMITGSPQFGAVAAGAPAMLATSALLGFALRKNKPQAWLVKCGLNILKETAIFSSAYLAQKGMTRATLLFGDPIAPRMEQRMSLELEKERALTLLSAEESACKKSLGGWSASCLMLRDWRWMRDQKDLSRWKTARLQSISAFYDSHINDLQDELLTLSKI